MTKINIDYDTAYKELAYSIWYTNNKPAMTVLYDLLPDTDQGKRPTPTTLVTWRRDFAWDDRANNTDIEVSKKTDRELIKIRLNMMKRHAKQAEKIAEEAFKFLTDTELGGFDSSASAVTAWSKAVEEEKRSTGLANALTQIGTLSDDDLKRRMNQLMSRLNNVSPLEEDEVIDAVSTEETPDE